MSTLIESSLRVEDAILSEVCLAGDPWMGTVKAGQTFRILDLEGNQAVDTLFYSADDTAERYSAADTIARNGQLYLSAGSKLYSSEGRVMLTIVADTCGRHDTLGGACSAESNTTRYALGKRPMHSCRDSFMWALCHCEEAISRGMGKRDIAPNINFFMNVPVTPEGELCFADGISGAGKYVELRAEMDVVVLISNCPQLNNPCNAYNPTPVQLLVWDAAH
jgi:urea carboxylase-associated protein 1